MMGLQRADICSTLRPSSCLPAPASPGRRQIPEAAGRGRPVPSGSTAPCTAPAPAPAAGRACRRGSLLPPGRLFFLVSARISLAPAGDFLARLGPLDGLLAGLVRDRGCRQEVGGARLDGQIRNFCGFEPLCHAHEVLGRPLAPAEFGLAARDGMTVPQRLLDGQEVVADLDDVLDGLLDPAPGCGRRDRTFSATLVSSRS